MRLPFLHKVVSGIACKPLINIQGGHVRKYRFFRAFLGHNQSALNTIAVMEQLYYSGHPIDPASVSMHYEALLEAAFGVLYSLESLSSKSYPALEAVLRELDAKIWEELEPACFVSSSALVLPFEQITPASTRMVGSKAGNLALMSNQLHLPIPHGFAITTHAFERFMQANSLRNPVERKLSILSRADDRDIHAICEEIQSLITSAPVPEELATEILAAYGVLENKAGKNVRIAMRSSAIGEDTEASFAGQYASILNVTKENILEAYKAVIASKYSSKAVSYRLQYGLDDRETPMGVAGVVMIDAKSSGVIYTADPASEEGDVVKIASLWGLGEHLVSGSASPDIFLVDKQSKKIVRRDISRKDRKHVTLDSGGTKLEDVPEKEQEKSSLDDAALAELAQYSLMIESFFGSPQDIEWALDRNGNLFLLQSRPLHVSARGQDIVRGEYLRHPILLAGGKTASPGIAAGRVFLMKDGAEAGEVPPESILVARTASPEFAKFTGTVTGIITDIGSITSHLASVAREFGIPALVDTKNATSLLPQGALVTLSASGAVVYSGLVEELVQDMKPVKKHIVESPVHRRMRRALDLISPLNLMAADDPSFAPEFCRTIHDIVRYTHERATREMFGIASEAPEGRSIRLTTTLPLQFYMIDLGGGLREGLTTCDTVTPDDIASVPMKALWRGFTHPGITWEGTVTFDQKNIMTLFAASAVSEFGEQPGGTSYAILSGDYLNLSVKFGYHFSTIDALCGDNSNQNYISLQFSGGAGSYYGKSLRIELLGNILTRLGFQVSLQGDLIEAFATGHDRLSQEAMLDQIGRMLASSRLLDMTLSSQSDVERFSDAFFREEYDYLNPRRDDELTSFYMRGGYWKRSVEDGRVFGVQDGSRSGLKISSSVVGIMGKLVGQSLQDFLDTIEAYYSFPLAIAKNSELSDGRVAARVQPVRGHIDRAGGIAFGIQNIGNYFVLRINALEDNVILFEYVNSKRMKRASREIKIASNTWYALSAEIKGKGIAGYLNGDLILEYVADKPVTGFVGLWTKADSVTFFDELIIETNGKQRGIPF